MKSNSKLNNKSKASSPFTGKPTIGINLANAVGGLYNLEAELKELEKPSLKPPKDNNNNKKKVLIKANNAPRKPEIKVISNKNNEKSNSQNIAQIEEFKNEPTIENINEKNTKKRLIFQLDYLKNTNISILNTLIEAFKNSPEFFEKIKLSPKDLSTLPPLSLYYYIKLLQSAIEPINPKYFRFNQPNHKILSKYAQSLKNITTYYQDPKFPPEPNWQAPETFIEKDQINLFKDISQYNIIQGNLGDCYLMGSLIALSENPYNIKKLFINTDYNNKGLYGVWLCESGNWKLILLDHYIPCFNNRPCYARSKNNELWVMLLEKAYAKAYLGYKNIVLGFSGDALKDLTGAPSEYIDLKEDFAWNLMVSAREKNFVLCVSTKSNKDLDSELISKHNYAILYLKAINNKELWLKLQNPLQGFSWKSDIKPNPEIEKALDYNEKDEKKGIFLINFKDFKENFEVVTCNKIHSDYYYSFVKIKENNKDNTSIIKAIVLEKTHCYISIHQKHERFFKGNKNKDYSYSVSRVIVCKIEENMIKKVLIGDFSTKQTTFVEVSLEIGEYLIYAEVDFLGDKYFERTISVYSSLPVVLDLIEKNTIEMKDTEILEEIFKIYLIENPKFAQITDYESSGLKKYNGTLWGFVYFWYKNDNKNVDLYEAVTLTKCENLFKFLPLNAKNNNYFEVVCKANDFRLVLYKIGSYSNGSHACTMSSLINLNENLDDKSLIELALLNGTKNKRTNEITLISYKFKGGTALVYQNKGKTSFAENLTFKILENIEIILQNGVLAKASNVAVKVTPNGYFLIRLNIKNPFIKKSGFNYSVI